MMLGCESNFQPKAEQYNSAYSMMSVGGHHNQSQANHGNQMNQWGHHGMPSRMPMMPFNPEMAAAMFAQMPQMGANMPSMPQQQMPPFGQMNQYGKMMMPQMMPQMPHNPHQQRLVYNPPPISPPPSRERFSYTRYQVELLNKIYNSLKYPNSMQKQLLAKRVGITRDQVKIWFQNRRRKDVTGKAKDIDMSGPQMVPDTIMDGILKELESFKNNPKGKAGSSPTSSTTETKKRKRDVDEDSDDNVLPQSKIACVNNQDCTIKQESPELSPVSLPNLSSCQNSSHTSSEHSSFGQSFNGSSNHQQGSDSYTAPSFPGEEPEFDMVNPPNVIAPTAPLEKLLEINPPSLESPVSEGEEVADKQEGPEDSSQNSPANEIHEVKKEPAPPNKVAPPSQPIPFHRPVDFNASGLSFELPADLSVTAALARLSPEHPNQHQQAHQIADTPKPQYCPTVSQDTKTAPQADANNNAPDVLSMLSAYQLNQADSFHNWFPQFSQGNNTTAIKTEGEEKTYSLDELCPFPMSGENGMVLNPAPQSTFPNQAGQYHGHSVNTMANAYYESNRVGENSYQQVVSPTQ